MLDAIYIFWKKGKISAAVPFMRTTCSMENRLTMLHCFVCLFVFFKWQLCKLKNLKLKSERMSYTKLVFISIPLK